MNDQARNEQPPALQITEYNATAAALADLRARYQAVLYDVKTTAGMNEAIKGRAELRDLRVTLESKRKEIKAPALERCRLIDSEAKWITEQLAALEDPIDEQIKNEQARKEREREEKAAAERKRVSDIHAKIADIRNLALAALKLTSKEVAAALAQAATIAVDDETFQEFVDEARTAKADTIEKLTAAKAALEEQETARARLKAERAEFETQKKEQEERDRKDREARQEQERQEAEQRRKAEASDAEFEKLRRWLMRAHQETMTSQQWHEFILLWDSIGNVNSAVDPTRYEEYRLLHANVGMALRTAKDKQDQIEAARAEEEAQFQRERAEFARKQDEAARKEAADAAAERVRHEDQDRIARELARRERLQAAKFGSLAKALARIGEIANDSDQYSDAVARDEIVLICEANVRAKAETATV